MKIKLYSAEIDCNTGWERVPEEIRNVVRDKYCLSYEEAEQHLNTVPHYNGFEKMICSIDVEPTPEGWVFAMNNSQLREILYHSRFKNELTDMVIELEKRPSEVMEAEIIPFAPKNNQ